MESLLRITVAVPVRVATFPTGSAAAAGAGEGAGAGGAGEGGAAGAGAGWICASLVGPEVARDVTAPSSCMADGTAKLSVVPASMKQPRSESANESRRRVTMESWARMNWRRRTSRFKDPAG
jgi:hypothetical protein